ncbi:MAG: phosphate ABC transporter substrate-binding protein PstS [Chthonomonadales bacterium]
MKPMNLRPLALGVFAMMMLMEVGCGKSAGPGGAGTPGGAKGTITLTGAGSTFIYPILSKWFQEYGRSYPAVVFNYQAVGSGAGIAQYTAGTVDFAATDVPLSDAELAHLPRPSHLMPIIVGAEAIVYNVPGIGPGLRLSGDVIADIYLGKITKWNDARIAAQNPGTVLPSLDIVPVHRADGSGTTYIFTTYLSAVSPEWKARVGADKSVNWPLGLGGNQNAGVAGNVQHNRGAIGYVELAYAVQNHLPTALVKNASGAYVAPSTRSTTAAAEAALAVLKANARAPIVNGAGPGCYPIAGFSYLVIPQSLADRAKWDALARFVEWTLGPGQRMAEELQYAPLPKELADANLALIKKSPK